ncbi:MAG: hypothetical protein ACYCW6_12585 [Candidatus Xenobia bacterium]
MNSIRGMRDRVKLGASRVAAAVDANPPLKQSLKGAAVGLTAAGSGLLLAASPAAALVVGASSGVVLGVTMPGHGSSPAWRIGAAALAGAAGAALSLSGLQAPAMATLLAATAAGSAVGFTSSAVGTGAGPAAAAHINYRRLVVAGALGAVAIGGCAVGVQTAGAIAALPLLATAGMAAHTVRFARAGASDSVVGMLGGVTAGMGACGAAVGALLQGLGGAVTVAGPLGWIGAGLAGGVGAAAGVLLESHRDAQRR